MKKSFLFSLAICLVLLATVQAAAQTPNKPAQVIWLYREDVKPARSHIHTKVESRYAQHWAKNGVQPFIGMDSLSGNAAETIFISAYPSYDAFEKDFQTFGKAASGAEYEALARQEAELVNSVRAIVAVYREDLSYRGERLVQQLPHARYVSMRTVRVKPGRDQDFLDQYRLVISTHKDANMDEEWVMYQVIAGAPSGTYLFFQPMKSIKDLAALDGMHDRYRAGLSDEVKSKLKKHSEDNILFDQLDLFAINPKESHVAKEFAAAAPDFWNLKPMAAMKPAPKKSAEKSTAQKQ